MSVAIENLIPHRAPMRWISELTGCTDATATATASSTENDFAVADGQVLETALVECVAQTVAAALGQRAQSGGLKSGAAPNAPTGMLVAASNFKILSRPAAGKMLQIEIRETKRLGPMLLIVGTILCDGQTIATGELSLYA
jgi:predicted hotdog family 3-hydroxylacyl-ACP dehydratase